MSQLPRYRFAGGTAVLTGAASGMGEQMAYGLARRGSDLVLVDRDADRLAEVAGRIRGVAVDRVVADLADVAGLDAVAADLLARHPRVTLLVNNAGVALGGTFDQVAAEEFDWVVDVNFRAPVALTRLLLPRLLESPGSHVVNVSSLFGLIAPPGQTAYSASKFALRGFTEALRHELADRGVGVTCVHPGGIRTRIAETARVARGVDRAEAEEGKANFAKLLTYPADKAAEQILAGVEKRRGRVLIAASAVVPDLLARLFPASYMGVMNRLRPAAARRASAPGSAQGTTGSPTR
ncbi:SDR family NAD(P)-dependent oxidoreductase [Saccharothrix syringae]|uniref:SDR family NAD(P)-dependent oxidoreductase n=1 Tax=Saccharothrix syringae TaxID=103733 RepID=A0A5Q0GVP9_SACSY|nr:SDR family NAD(P)-dependent oxidoreductase [Saccharothrix syringae]QFZ18196.1 SDR family NAD(P)-dependent oxidoreductase [Saccharothrix syringae]